MAGTNSKARPAWWHRMAGCSDMPEGDCRRHRIFLLWVLVWAVVFVGAGIVQNMLAAGSPLGWAIAFLPALPAVGALTAYIRFLRHSDELVRKIQLEGLALGFGAGVILIIGAQLPDHAGVPTLEPDHILLVMMVAWAIGQILATRRYR